MTSPSKLRSGSMRHEPTLDRFCYKFGLRLGRLSSHLPTDNSSTRTGSQANTSHSKPNPAWSVRTTKPLRFNDIGERSRSVTRWSRFTVALVATYAPLRLAFNRIPRARRLPALWSASDCPAAMRRPQRCSIMLPSSNRAFIHPNASQEPRRAFEKARREEPTRVQGGQRTRASARTRNKLSVFRATSDYGSGCERTIREA
jgi:hypothetical protein